MYEWLGLFTHYGYWILFFGVMADNIGLPLPGEIFILLASTIGVASGLNPIAIFGIATLGAFMGDQFSYFIGWKAGAKPIAFYCRVTLCSRRCSQQTELFYKRFGKLTIVLSRFIIGVRALAIPMAGMLRVPYRTFLFYDLAGAMLWAGLFTLGGFFLGRHFIAAMESGRIVALWIVAGLLTLLVSVTIHKYYRIRRYGPGSLTETGLQQKEDSTIPIVGKNHPLAEDENDGRTYSIESPE